MIHIIGHRGAAGLETENTLSSFAKAVELRVDYIENDIWELADGNHIIFHDNLLDRVTNSTGRVSDYTLPEIKMIHYKNQAPIMTLEEYLDRVSQQPVKTIFELKQTVNPIAVLNKIEAVLAPEDYIIRSFFHDKIQTIKEYNPDITTGILFEGVFNHIEQYLENSTADIVGVGFESVTPEYIQKIQNHKKIAFWTLDNEVDIQDAIVYKPWGLLSNYPDVLKQKLG